jgi:hypothetical protein
VIDAERIEAVDQAVPARLRGVCIGGIVHRYASC